MEELKKEEPRLERLLAEAEEISDTMSEFSRVDQELPLKGSENILDLIIGQGQFQENQLIQAMGADLIGEEAFHTFCTVDFYDHDSKSTDVADGFRPNYATQFAFRNAVDDHYL
jgi:hypothetical protein